MITENLSTLKIHKLTQAQYDRELASGNIDGNSIYLTPDELDITLTQSGVAADAKAVGDAIAELAQMTTNTNAPKDYIILNSSTAGSTKQFKITIDDDGVLTATEIIKSAT
jgi:hypothetical protein